MKLSLLFFLTIICVLQANTGLAQAKVTLDVKDTTIESVIDEIETKTDYKFIFDRTVVDLARKITLKVNDQEIETVLDELFSNTKTTYQITKNKILLLEKKNETGSKSSNSNKQQGTQKQVQVSGTVTDESNFPIPGTTVLIKGTTRGTATNIDGTYTITVPEEETILVFSSLGFKTQEVQVENKLVINITLIEAISQLDEVVLNAGYYNTTQREATGSISKVDSKTIEKQPVYNPLAALQGRMPGVYIQQTTGVPGGDFNIQIRGRNSLRDDGNAPLYIVDGVPFSTEKTFSGEVGATVTFGFRHGASPLASINPSDIESIEILKDADATAIYGSRGANGVVLITTKKGKASKTTFDFNIYSGLGKAPHIELLNTKQFLEMRREAFASDGITPSSDPSDPGYAPELTLWDQNRDTNWQDVLMGGFAEKTTVQASVSGGRDNTQFLFSLGYNKENSVYLGDFDYKRGSFHLSINHSSPNKKFSISTSMIGSSTKNNQLNSLFVREARRLAPNAPELYKNGELNWENSTWLNPLAQLEQSYDADATSFTGNTVIGFDIIPGLRYKTSLGINYFQSDEITKFPSTLHDPANGFTSAQSVVFKADGTNSSWIIEPQLNWRKKIAKGKLSVLIGATLQEQDFDRKADMYQDFPSNALLDNFAAASFTNNFEFVQSLYRYAALYGRLNYNWDEKYVVNLTARRDGSSRFGPGKQFANFGALGVAWIFSSEAFIKNKLPFISFGKLRSSYGSTGSDQIGNYQFLDTYSTSTSGSTNQYQGITGLSPTRLFNPNYAWEINKKFEAAIELGLLKDRVSMTMSYYNNRSSNQLVNFTLPRTTGFSGVLANLPATVQNTGIEIELSTVNMQSETFGWTSAFNISIPRNKLIEFPNLESSTYANRYVVGEPLSIVKVYESTGVDPQTGLYTFRDVNEDGQISFPEDDTKVAFVGRDFFGGLNNSLTYKGITLDVFFQFVKQTGFNYFWTTAIFPGGQFNIPEFILKKKIWRVPGDDAELQRLITVNNVEGLQAVTNNKNSDAAISDTSFIRLKNVSLSYQIPKKWTKGLDVRLYFQGQNLFTLTGYEGGDPENQYQVLPPLKMFTTGVQLKL